MNEMECPEEAENAQVEDTDQFDPEAVVAKFHPPETRESGKCKDSAIRQWLANVNASFTEYRDFSEIVTEEVEQHDFGERAKKSFCINNDSASAIQSMYQQTVETFEIIENEPMENDISKLEYENDDVSTLVKTANEVNELEIEVDDIQDSIALFKKISFGIKGFRTKGKKNRPSEAISEASTSSSRVSSSDFSFTVLQNKVVTSSPCANKSFPDDDDMTTLESKK